MKKLSERFLEKYSYKSKPLGIVMDIEMVKVFGLISELETVVSHSSSGSIIKIMNEQLNRFKTKYGL